MPYGDTDKIRLMTGWTSTDIPTSNLEEMVDIADTFIDSTGMTLNSSEREKASNLLACHLGEKYFHGDKNNISVNGISVALRSGDDLGTWLQLYNDFIKLAGTGASVYKVNG